MKFSTIVWLFFAVASSLSGCSRQEPATAITGTLSYRTPVKFDTGATLELRLTDVSVSDGPAVEVAKLTDSKLTALPYQYSLPYDATKIDAQHRYTMDARIVVEGKLRFSTDTAYSVLTEGAGQQRNITLIAIGEDNPASARDTSNSPTSAVFQGELRSGADVSIYKVGMDDGHIIWLEEDRSNNTPQPLHARYEFKGALILRYVDTSPLEINFDERGRPTGVVKNQQALKLSDATATIDQVRSRAELLRSHALAGIEAKTHREQTGQDRTASN